MTKDEARALLNDYIMKLTDCTYEIGLPIRDVNVVTNIESVEEFNGAESHTAINSYSFRHLLCVAYDLKPTDV